MSYQYDFKFYDEVTDEDYDCEVILTNTHEPNYGADADGHRGESRDFVEIEEFFVMNQDGLIMLLDKSLLKRAEAEFEARHEEKAFSECADHYHNSSSGDCEDDDYDDQADFLD